MNTWEWNWSNWQRPTSGRIVSVLLTNEIELYFGAVEKNLTDSSTWEMDHFVEAAKNRIQNTILTAMDDFVVPRNELTVRLKSASSGRKVGS